MQPCCSEFITLRGLRTHIRHWGNENSPMLFMAHGWMDVAASFQFVVDHLQQDWHVIAHDWRGFGLSDNGGTDGYWFADYLGDLDALLAHYSPDEAVNLLGHSMGGNVVMLYAGVRPERVKKLINLEGFGMQATQPEQAPKRYAKWLQELRTPPILRSYASRAEVALRLQKTNPRLSDERAEFLSQYWAAENAAGEWDILADPLHKSSSPILYRLEEALACWRQISAPVLWVEAEHTELLAKMGNPEQVRSEIARRIAHVPHLQQVIISQAGHMLHHDQPEQLASLIEEFLNQPSTV